MKITVLALIAAACVGLPATAQSKEDTKASAAEIAQVNASLAKIGCKAEEVEKESATLFEVDDAKCEIGQYDIKLDASYRIVSITIDE